jgi:PIN domain nuclease of toxin-antitoxin system
VRLLLDTCTFLWIAGDAPELAASARQLFQEPDNEVYLSPISGWEIVLKHSLGRLPLPQPPQSFVPTVRKQHGIEVLPLGEDAALHLGRLPQLHRDPFDRMLICQAIFHGLVILTPDELISQYPVPTAW